MEYINPQILGSIPQEQLNTAISKANEHLKKMKFTKLKMRSLKGIQITIKTMAEGLPEIHLTDEQAEIIAYDRVYNDANYVFFDHTKQTLESLKEKVTIGVISDTDPSIKRVLKKMLVFMSILII
ncbi:hypothetical protein ACFTAO_10785 [Paenibacillus rhizoplanae]